MTTSGAETRPTIGDLPAFVDIPSGQLPPGEGGGRTEGFRLAAFPTTVGQYWHYLVDQGLDTSPDPRLHGMPGVAGTGLRRAPGGHILVDEHLRTLPVTGVTWHGALAYCSWLGDRTGTCCRLPTAAEWHYAAAGPDKLRWALGNVFDRPTYAPAANAPRPVGGSPANGFGLYDMTGNVFEWCADPLTANGPTGDTALGSRVIKGGAFTVRNPESFENATAFTADELSTVPYLGFRVLAVARTRACSTESAGGVTMFADPITPEGAR